MERIFLLPCDIVVVSKPTRLATLLGSCVSVCLQNTHFGVASMNHFMLPSQGRYNDAESVGRYGDTAIHEMLRRALAIDTNRRHYRAHIYGGGAVISDFRQEGTQGIGASNIAMARRILADKGIPIVAENVGGTHGRRIQFNTADGNIQCNDVSNSVDSRTRPDKPSVGLLIVDDSRMVRQMLRRALDGCEGLHIVGEATNPFDAREKILDLDPDVITLDISMPRMDGLTFLKSLMNSYPKPVVILSSLAKPGSEAEQEARRSGAWGVFDKDKLELFKGVKVLQEVLAPVLLAAARSQK